MKKSIIFSVLVFAAIPHHAMAFQNLESSSKSENSDESTRLNTAMNYLETIGYVEQVKATMAQTAPQFLKVGLDIAEQREGIIADDLRQKLTTEMSELIEDISDDFARTTKIKAAAIFAESFTVEELNQLTEFQKQPVMKKLNRINPELTSKLINVGIEGMQTYQPVVQERLEALVIDYFEDQAAQPTS